MENKILCGDCIAILPQLDDKSISLVVTSPPYAEQRSKLYTSIPEEDYPAWMTGVLEAMRPKLKDDASVLVVIRTNQDKGEVSDYVMKTRLSIRAAGWKEPEELIWLKNDAPPLGSTIRPRRTWENILWFCKTNKPYIDLKACGNPTKRIGFAGSDRFGQGGTSPIAAKQNREMKDGISKVADHFIAYVGEIDRGIMHPAMFPITLAEKLIKTFSRQDDLILDPFMGSGQTGLAVLKINKETQSARKFIGIEMMPEYCEIAIKRLETAI